MAIDWNGSINHRIIFLQCKQVFMFVCVVYAWLGLMNGTVGLIVSCSVLYCARESPLWNKRKGHYLSLVLSNNFTWLVLTIVILLVTLDITPPKYCMTCSVKHLVDKLYVREVSLSVFFSASVLSPNIAFKKFVIWMCVVVGSEMLFLRCWNMYMKAIILKWYNTLSSPLLLIVIDVDMWLDQLTHSYTWLLYVLHQRDS